jgi:hypothetical protein
VIPLIRCGNVRIGDRPPAWPRPDGSAWTFRGRYGGGTITRHG